ncbi:transcriptional regulator with HTH domain and aminotransferase domain [Frateuria aurantia DSM 6220]|uniref:Transcriptional regulator with HTH domain and aminotransferase domain n=2 Tax=Frateuria aurantia TaxID=81475 RepID=H8L441_FRAAD|nr:transcriptional regulator with HTH domain and aminotransferase domain [Frateuria aurantia DSM 6220]
MTYPTAAARRGSRTESVMQDMRDRIASRSLAAGARLPSVRACAQMHGVSVSTVVDAYDRLVAEGVIEARRGSGFYVSDRLVPLSLNDAGDRRSHVSDPVWVARQALESGEAMHKPGCGWLPADWMPDQDIRRALRAMARQPLAPLTAYGTPQGLPALRQLLCRRIGERGISAGPEQLLLTESGTQAVDLLCRYLLEPGDTVLVDDPCYFSFHAMLRAHRASVVSVPYTPNGPDLAAFEQCLSRHRPRLYITNSGLQNPTGAALSFEVAHRLLQLAQQHEMWIIEDDVLADFEWRPAPRLAALDGLQRVIHTGSFSKTLSASVRCGYIAAGVKEVAGLVDLKLATAFESGHFSAEMLLQLLRSGAYRRHMEGLRKRLAEAMTHTIRQLGELGIVPWAEPRGGMFLWCRLPQGISASDLARRALASGVMLAPGGSFSQAADADSYLRFNVSQSLAPDIYSVLAREITAGGG